MFEGVKRPLENVVNILEKHLIGMSDEIKHFYEFEGFRLDPDTLGLWRGGQLVQIFPKALEILVLLVGKHGASREELLESVWRDT